MRLLHCVVVGGGPTGIEFSGELSDFIMRDVCERYAHVKDYIHVTLIEVGTVIESASEYHSSRLTKKERKQTFADELLSDVNHSQYRKRKIQEIEEHNRPGGVDKWKIRGQQSRRRAKQRRH